MAYLEMGFSHAELRQRFQKESEELPLTELYARFGKPQFSDPRKPPYRFMLDEETDVNGIPGYNELRRPTFEDGTRRQYTLVSSDGARTLVYVRLPKGITAREERDGVSLDDRQDFPRNGEVIEFRDRRGLTHRLVVRGVVAQRMATALVQLEDPVPEGVEDRDEKREEQRLDRQIAKYKRKFKIEEGDTDLSPESAALVTRASRPSHQATPRPRTSGNLAKLPRIPTLGGKFKKL